MLKSMIFAITAAIFLSVSLPASAQEWKPEVNIGQIVSMESRTQALQEISNRRQVRLSENWKRFDTAKAGYFREYLQVERSTLLAARSADFQSYLGWLDAKELGETATQEGLERSIPALSEYRKKIQEAYTRLFKEREEIAYKAYKDREVQIWNVFREVERLIWDTWRTLPK